MFLNLFWAHLRDCRLLAGCTGPASTGSVRSWSFALISPSPCWVVSADSEEEMKNPSLQEDFIVLM